jgi:hypothetical protein
VEIFENTCATMQYSLSDTVSLLRLGKLRFGVTSVGGSRNGLSGHCSGWRKSCCKAEGAVGPCGQSDSSAQLMGQAPGSLGLERTSRDDLPG